MGNEHDDGSLEIEIVREPGDDTDAAFASRGLVGQASATRRIFVVSGAKGGVGKTTLATNVALYLATIGRQVVVVDADPEGANAHTMLGVDPPRPVLSPYVGLREVEHEPLIESPVPGLKLMHGGLDEPARGQHRRSSFRALRRAIDEIDAQFVVVDVGAGTDPGRMDLWLSADVPLFVSVPDPTAVENTYRFMRAAFARQLCNEAPNREVRRQLLSRLRAMGNTPAPVDLARRLEAAGDPLADHVRDVMARFRFPLVLNQTRLRSDWELGDAMRTAVRRRFSIDLDYLGHVDHDDHVWNCLRMRRPLLVESAGTKASKSIERMARRLLNPNQHRRAARPDVPPESHHDLLEVDRGATEEEIRRANKRIRDIYGEGSLCCYGLFDEASLISLRARVEEAYDVLLDPARRKPYELSVFPYEPEPEQWSGGHQNDDPKPPAPVITPDTEFSGPLLRAVRESQGMDLREISQRTKIGTGYLQAIEQDDFGQLPAPVYVRGFVTEVAKCLRLNANQVSRTYLRRLKRHEDEQEKLS